MQGRRQTLLWTNIEVGATLRGRPSEQLSSLQENTSRISQAIMPAPTVLLVTSSIKMNEPVARLCA